VLGLPLYLGDSLRESARRQIRGRARRAPLVAGAVALAALGGIADAAGKHHKPKPPRVTAVSGADAVRGGGQNTRRANGIK
jgi:hypothetical protein